MPQLNVCVPLHGTFRADLATNQRWHEFYTLDSSNSNKPLFGKQEPALYARYVVSGLSMPALSQECTLQYPEVGSNEEQNILLLHLKFSGGCTSLEYFLLLFLNKFLFFHFLHVHNRLITFGLTDLKAVIFRSLWDFKQETD